MMVMTCENLIHRYDVIAFEVYLGRYDVINCVPGFYLGLCFRIPRSRLVI